MANNRMYLVNTRTGTRIYLAKYYPSFGWSATINIKRSLNSGFDAADFGHLTEEERGAKRIRLGFGRPYSGGGAYGDEWRIEYEVNSGVSLADT